MCGIAAVITGVRISSFYFFREFNDALLSWNRKEYEGIHLSIDELKAALQRRGPDNLGSRKLLVKLSESTAEDSGDDKIISTLVGKSVKRDFSFALETSKTEDAVFDGMKSAVQLDFIGATLQLRGSSPVHQPLVDASGNLLVYNGEIFGGVQFTEDSNDSEVLLHALERCCTPGCRELHFNGSCSAEHRKSVPEILSAIKGPWALIYWQEKSKTIWFGRDALGRRSLLVHWPTSADSRFVLSSVSPPLLVPLCSGSSLIDEQLDGEVVLGETNSAHDIYWEELPCGIYSIELKAPGANVLEVKEVLFEVRKHEWTAPMLSKIISWDRLLVDPKMDFGNVVLANKVLSALQKSVKRRSKVNSLFQV
ncbi:hypothetical protein AXF42_Ash011442 [Apostasia shenzhenica]|uniref:Glutamine amidotransferase type-2 domain-containing protein n=1 Tax=Apostasia shenzhenica TaxID=1088818 RepID=A0A2I0AEI9_9ASPA|nr:hypothetical protein AXF42_Ash011442 [Apostasia shenzhenica]